MLVSRGLHVLCPWDLDLDIGPVLNPSSVRQVRLLAIGTVEVLGSLVHQLAGWRSAHRQVYVLGGAASSGPSPALGGVIPVPLDALDELASLRVHLGKGVDGVVCVATLIAHASAEALQVALDECAVASAAFSRVRDVMKIHLSTIAVVAIPGVLQARCCLLEAPLYRRVHSRVEWTGHIRWHMVGTVIVRLVLTTTVGPRRRTSGHIAVLIRQHGAGVHLRGLGVSVD